VIIVNVELVPGGSLPHRRSIGSLHIANVSNLADVSSYAIDAIEVANPLVGTSARITSCRIDGHARAQSVWALIARAVAALETADFVEL
jgi:hypothetical protein